ncbi:MAG: UDP-3-O-(3-hydroxymyristoyl)glucosamine N-acyltransferase [Ignavibacteriaceae bacterium]|nr:UDP-3-O-(3-hydroxymyristoyl)glucosamine N-acyltransferase [Ignavibacteriaceae bacterium]
MNIYSLNDILNLLPIGYKVEGSTNDISFDNVKPIEEANERSLVWIKGKKENKQELVEKTLAKTIICDPNLLINKKLSKQKCFIIVSDPKLTFLRIAEHFFVHKKKYGVHVSAIIDPEAEISPNSYIGPLTYIGKSKIGENTFIDGNCFIYDDVIIGNNVRVQAGTVIGSDGYGYQRNENMVFEKFPHIGGVVIEDNVDIGSNTCIDRGALGDTIIKEGAKIDNLVHVAHNVVIGKHCAVIANAMLGGSVIIADYSWVAPSASILNQVSIGENVTVGMAAVVTKNIPDGETWAGVPARPLKEFIETQKAIKNLTRRQEL